MKRLGHMRKCEDCSRLFIMEQENVFRCPECLEQWNNRPKVIAPLHHTGWQLADRTFGPAVPRPDDRSFSARDRLADEKRFVCEFCQKRYTSQYTLSRHEESAHRAR